MCKEICSANHCSVSSSQEAREAGKMQMDDYGSSGVLLFLLTESVSAIRGC